MGCFSERGKDLVIGERQVVFNINGILAVREYFKEEILQMNIVYPSYRMEIDLCKHKVTSQKKGLGRLISAYFYPQSRFFRSFFLRSRRGRLQNPQGIDQSVMVEFTICHTDVVGIS